MSMRTEAHAVDAARPREDAAPDDERNPAQRAWQAPDFEEIDLGNEITMYVGRW